MAKYKIFDFLAGLKINISQGYGERVDYYKQLTLNPQTGLSSLTNGHEGTDFPTITGTPLFAPFDGIIVRDEINQIGWKNYGTYTVIWDPVQCIAVWFCHLQDFVTTVGQKVKAGDLLLHTNNTGTTSGEHVHVNFCETDSNGIRLNQDNGSLGFLNIMDPALVEVLPLPGKDLSVPPFTALIAPQPVSPTTDTYPYGLDITNQDTIRVVVDTWRNVVTDQYKSIADYNDLLRQKNELVAKLAEMSDKYTTDLKDYTEMVAGGYSSLDDIQTKLKQTQNENTALTTILIKTKDRNQILSDQVKTFEGEDIACLRQYQQLKDQASELEHTVIETAKVLKAEPTTNSIFSALDKKFRWYEAKIKALQQTNLSQSVSKPKAVSTPQTDSWTSLFGLLSGNHVTND